MLPASVFGPAVPSPSGTGVFQSAILIPHNAWEPTEQVQVLGIILHTYAYGWQWGSVCSAGSFYTGTDEGLMLPIHIP